VYVVVESGQRVFKKGTAAAVAGIAPCQYCSPMDTDSRTITIGGH
jgi:threonine dehydrogenase-like Zn-dependent dehydrogenase